MVPLPICQGSLWEGVESKEAKEVGERAEEEREEERHALEGDDAGLEWRKKEKEKRIKGIDHKLKREGHDLCVPTGPNKIRRLLCTMK